MILHLDGDNFFVSCELLRRRDLLGKAVVVGEERGIATAMNAEAKKLGITRGYPVYKIRQEWSEREVAVLPSHFEMYRQLGGQVLRILEKYSAHIEPYSVDENFVELTEKALSCTCAFRSADIFSQKNSSCSLQLRLISLLKAHMPESFFLTHHTCCGLFEALALHIQKDIYNATGLWYSCGIARTKALAKIASKRNKPKGVCVIMHENETEVLETTPIENVWGIGRRLAPQMRARHIYTGREYRDASRSMLSGIDHKGVLELQDELRGEVRFEAGHHAFQKSVETTRAFGCITTERSFVLSEFSRNVETVCDRLVQLGVVARHASFFIRTEGHARIYAESPLVRPTQSAHDVVRDVMHSFEALVDSYMHAARAVRGVCGTGVTMSECIPFGSETKSLFETDETIVGTSYMTPRASLNDIQHVAKHIRDLYGSQALQLASSLQAAARRKDAYTERSKKDVEKSGGEYVYGLPLVYLGEVQ